MPKRPSRPSGPPTFVSKTFTREEIDRGIEKLRRRIAEVQKLQEVKYNDQAVSTAELNIQEAIGEIFGDDSAEYYKHRYYDIWEGSIVMGDSPYDIQRKFEAGILKAVSMLEGLIARLEEKRAELEGAPHRAASLHDLNLHPRIADVVGKLYEGGHYGNAVLDAAIALKNLVQEKSGQHGLDGAPLMRTVFSPNNPILVFNDLTDQTDKDEQEGMMHLYEGVMLGVRNPRAHDLFDQDPQRALEYIGLISLLAKRVGEAKKVKP
jgi:uncharacterized protein (TIGR02391 family)